MLLFADRFEGKGNQNYRFQVLGCLSKLSPKYFPKNVYLNIENIILYHTEDHNLKNRKELYIGEGKKYFKGNIFVPNDLEFFDIE